MLAEANDTELLVSLTAIFFIFGLPVMGWLMMRYLAHRERMEMLRQGLDPRLTGKYAFRSWQAQGQPGPVPRGGPPNDSSCGTGYDYGYGYANMSAQVALRKAIVIVAVGFALTIGLSFIGYNGSSITPGPWLLGGLVPLFVGIAQVFSAMAAGATLRPFRGVPPQYFEAPAGPPPSGGGMPPPPGPPPAGTYTYRPGATPELRPPNPPVQRDK
jgi:hypothetical protein